MIERYKKINYLPSSYLNELLFVEDAFLDLEVDSDTYIIGDLHQDDESFFNILNHTKFFEKDDVKLIFLGDYVDRGEDIWLINKLLVLKYEYPNRIYLLRGNHEISKNSTLIPPKTNDDDFFNVLDYFVSEGQIEKEIISIYEQIFESLPIAIRLKFKGLRFFLVHGGVPRIDLLHKYPQKLESFLKYNSVIGIKYLNDFLWSDIGDDNYTSRIRYEVSEDELNYFLDTYNFDYLIRAHQYFKDGYSIDYNRVITIFSNGSNYKSGFFNERSAYNVTPTIMHINSGIIFYVDKDSLIPAKTIYFTKKEKSNYNFPKISITRGFFYKGDISKVEIKDLINRKKIFLNKKVILYKDISSLYGVKKDFKIDLSNIKIFPYFIDGLQIDVKIKRVISKKYIKRGAYVLSRNKFCYSSRRKSKIKKI